MQKSLRNFGKVKVFIMGILSYSIDCFEECAKLISQNEPSKSMFAVILIDALIDMYSHQYIHRRCGELQRSLEIRKNIYFDNSDFQDDMKKAKDSCNKFDNRFDWLAKNCIISNEQANSIKMLHEYRNKYLHRLKKEKTDCIAFAKLYFYLFEQLFIAVPINCITGTDCEDLLIKKIREKRFDIFSADFRKEIVDAINKQYVLCFSKDDFLNILKDFLSKQYDDIIYSLHFIIDSAVEKSVAISIIEKECKSGKVIVEYFGGQDDLHFSCTTTKCQSYLGKIRNLLNCSNENEGLQKFTRLYESLEEFSAPIHKKAIEIDMYIQLQIDMMRGK